MNALKQAFILLLLIPCIATSAMAAPPDRHRPSGGYDRGNRHGNSYHSYKPDQKYSRHDRHHHNRHDNRKRNRNLAWFVVGSTLLLSAMHANSHQEPVSYTETTYYPEPVVVSTPTIVPPPPPPVIQQYWYYCTNPAGYYPYVPACRNRWQAVPANP